MLLACAVFGYSMNTVNFKKKQIIFYKDGLNAILNESGIRGK